MDKEKDLYEKFAKTGAITGVIAVLMYFSAKILHTQLPDFVYYALLNYQGPMMAFAWLGMYSFFRLKGGLSITLITAVIFAIISAVTRTMFLTVQLNNLIYIEEYRKVAPPELQTEWRNILNGVFTVQNGLNITSDIFLDLAVMLFGTLCWKYNLIGKFLAIFAFISGGLHFVFKAYTFPKPPASEGLFDAGPLVTVWSMFMTIWMLKYLYLDNKKSMPNNMQK